MTHQGCPIESRPPIYVYCVKTEPQNDRVICRSLNLTTEVLYMGVTPRLNGKSSYKAGIPMFVTQDGTYLQLDNVSAYKDVLSPLGFDRFHPSYLVNVRLIDRIEAGPYGNDAYFKGEGNISVPISKARTAKYKQLVVKVGADQIPPLR
ncbi:LytTR family DNA-binding domain-containing protein [Paenibacillus albus]|uniref:LytTR family transcriptional regulator n=1 Tax=Paenibacillus albus TaxID=2495582 RepID=A0A3Q8XAU9_9BACL|nr:LytTR family DNA-binding domain-containing protein [Paenibacillus albus]AZN43319.1 LytTR family transcriptional regulator [Paenibacillus albus]